MKNKLTLTLLVLAAICFGQQAKAQVKFDVTTPVILSIDLSASVISIELGATPAVNFVYATAADYASAKTIQKPGHLTVISNKAYDLAVKAETEFASTSSENLPLSLVTVSVDAATANGGTLNSRSLTMANQTLVTSADPSTTAVFDVDYSIPDASQLIALAKEVYTTTVVYTATQL